MKLEIIKFKKHAGIIVDCPASITGGNDTGKTTILQAFLWCLNEKDETGREFTASNIYDKNDTEKERWAEVAFYLPTGEILRKKAKPLYVRERGTDFEVLKTELNCEYFVNESPVKKSDYDERIKEICAGLDLSLFSNPMYFFDLPQKEKLKIISKITNLSLVDYLTELPNKAILQSEIRKQKEQIEELDIKSKSLRETFASDSDNERNTARISAINLEIEQLNIEEKTAVPVEVLTKNAQIREHIQSFENSKFIPKQNEVFIPETKKSFLEFQDYKENQKLAEMGVKWRSLEFQKAKIIESIELQAKQKETVGSICEATTTANDFICCVCPYCDKTCCTEIVPNTTKEGAANKIAAKIESIDSEITRLNEKLTGINNEIESIIETGKKLRADDEIINSEIVKKNKEIKQQNELIAEANETINERNEKEQNRISKINAEIQRENASGAILFENEKTRKIEELKSQLVTNFQKIDNTEKINALAKEKHELQKIDNEKEQQKYSYNVSQNAIKTNSEKSELIREGLVQNERLLIKIENAEKQYRIDCENKIAEFLPEGIEIQLFRKLINSDGFEECATLKIDGFENPNTSRANSKLSILCDKFQWLFGVCLPILFDNAENCERKNMPKLTNIIELRVLENAPLTIKSL